MAIPSADKTFNSAIQPVGEEIVLNFNEANAAPGTKVEFDFDIDSGYVATNLEVTKTVEAQITDGTLKVEVLRVSPGTDAEAVAEMIAVTFAPLVLGEVKVAGVDPAIAAASDSLYSNGTLADPIQEVLPDSTASASGLTKQRIRIRMTAGGTSQSVSNKALVRVELARLYDMNVHNLAEVSSN